MLSSPSPSMICVVIPYFQRTPGVLRRALASIATQRNCPLPVHVIVIDDASPAPASAEIAATDLSGHSLEVIVQPNAGPGGARNTGLAHAPSGTRYLAFLDSDDEWSPDHLARAVEALTRDHDFYFADHLQLGQTIGAFGRAGRIKAADHTALAGGMPQLYSYRGDMLDQIIRGNVVGTSTVVYDFRHFPRQRFRREFANAGEDYLFWMELAAQGARVAFSTQIEATYGKGVNIYSGAGWGQENHLLRVHNEIRFKRLIGHLFKMSQVQKRHVAASIRTLRTAFARDLLHRLSHRKQLPFRLLAAHLMMDPLSYLWIVPTVASLLRSRS